MIEDYSYVPLAVVAGMDMYRWHDTGADWAAMSHLLCTRSLQIINTTIVAVIMVIR